MEAAVGQILVQAFQARLPNYGVVHEDRVALGRGLRRRSNGSVLALIPRHLLTINWADSAPGISWPEAYNLVFVPGHDQHVVIASQDGTDVYGCTDHALGYFDAQEPVQEAAGRVIRGHWGGELAEHDQSPWAYVWDEGLVSSGLAQKWRARVWKTARKEVVETGSRR